MLSKDITRDDRGVDRCARTVAHAVHNVPNDDSKGFHNVVGPCGMPITQRISDGVKACPRCDKEPATGNPKPRTINAAGIALTPKELQECGLTEDSSLKPAVPKTTYAFLEEPKMEPSRKDVIVFEVPIAALESNDIPQLLVQQAITSLDTLPVANFGESRRLMTLRDKLVALLGA